MNSGARNREIRAKINTHSGTINIGVINMDSMAAHKTILKMQLEEEGGPMSEKNLDRNRRWRNITVAFRVSPEENERINAAVRISGLTKQEYITRRLEDMEVVVQGNPKVFWGLREELRAVAEQLRRLESVSDMDPELLAELKMISSVMKGMKEEEH